MYYGLLAFAPRPVEANRRYVGNDLGRANMSELLVLYAGHLYREAAARRPGR